MTQPNFQLASYAVFRRANLTADFMSDWGEKGAKVSRHRTAFLVKPVRGLVQFLRCHHSYLLQALVISGIRCHKLGRQTATL